MMYRISKLFRENDFDLIDYFENTSRNKINNPRSTDYIYAEFKRCNYSNTVKNLKNLVKGYTYLFMEN
jgi:hypothetical protein